MLRSPPAPPPLLAPRLGLLSLSCSLHILCPWLSSRRLHRPLQNLAHVHNSGPHPPPVSPAPLLASGPAPPRHSPSTEACCAHSRQASSLPAPRPSDCLRMLLFFHSLGFKPQNLQVLLLPHIKAAYHSSLHSAFDVAKLPHFTLIQPPHQHMALS